MKACLNTNIIQYMSVGIWWFAAATVIHGSAVVVAVLMHKSIAVPAVDYCHYYIDLNGSTVMIAIVISKVKFASNCTKRNKYWKINMQTVLQVHILSSNNKQRNAQESSCMW